MGYVQSGHGFNSGEFSVRGGIIDIYPLTESDPLRIELFDTEIDSIRSFSLDDQRSKEKMSEITIGPATEVILEDKQYSLLIGKLEDRTCSKLEKIKE